MANSDFQTVTTLAVNLYGRRVGILHRLGGDQYLFSFEESYVDDPARPGLIPDFRTEPTTIFVFRKELEAMSKQTALRFSLAGVKLKFSAIMQSSVGLTIPADGMGGSWIVKLPSERFPSIPENEYAMLALARAVGIEVPQAKLVDAREIDGLPREAARLDGKALAVERFDRGPSGVNPEAIHMEDFAQVFGLFPQDKYPYRSYANIAAVLWAETGESGTFEFFCRLVFSVLIGNGDLAPGKRPSYSALRR